MPKPTHTVAPPKVIERRPLTAPEREISLPLDELQAKGVEVEH